jgi:elongation factor G
MEKFRNLCLLSHSGAGKTSLSEAILFDAGAITRLGKVDDGTTTSDYDPDEIKRKISLNLSLLPFQWREIKVNLIDAPGYADFVGEVKSAIRVSEGAVVLVCASSGVEVGTDQAWEYCKEAELPRLIFVSKMDRENADFFRTVQDIQLKFGIGCQPVQLPIGAQSTFKGIVDLLRMKSYTGVKGQEAEIPAELKTQADSFHAKLVEAVAAADEKLIEKYLNDEAISQEELEAGLKQAVVTGKIVPILVGSALQNIGVIPLMDAICGYLPSPGEREVVVLEDSKEKKVKPSAGAPLAALVFKTSADPYVGKLTYFRVYSGSIASNSPVWNANRNEAERIGQLYMMRGKNQEAVAKVDAGDIGVVAKLSLTSTGDTLCTRDKPVKIAPIVFPEPMFSQAIFPKTKADLDKLGSVLTRLTEEDPTLRVRRDPDTGETVISGLGETQLAVVMDKMTRKFGVGVELKMPKVPYKETIAVGTKAEFKHKKQTGGHGQYGHVMLELEPLPRGTGLQFENKVVGGSIPRNYIPAVEKGVNEAAQEGVLAGYPVTDLRAIVYDGSFHPVDSSDICFKIAGAGALKKGMTQAQPVLVEPIVNLKVTVPESYTGDIMSDLNNKRGRVLGMMPQDGMSIIEAQVPMAEVLRYSIDLKSITQGRGKYSYTFDHYEEVPAHLLQKIIAERQAEKAAEKAA